MVVTRRPTTRTTISSGSVDKPWFHELIDPSDAQVSAVLTGARALLGPSHYKGFGMPLLEAHQLGTGFLSHDTGAAPELALPGDDVLPLDEATWADAVAARVDSDPGSPDKRRATARRYT